MRMVGGARRRETGGAVVAAGAHRRRAASSVSTGHGARRRDVVHRAAGRRQARHAGARRLRRRRRQGPDHRILSSVSSISSGPLSRVRRGGGPGRGQTLRAATPAGSKAWGRPCEPRRSAAIRASVRVAVIDVGFENLDVLDAFGAGRVEGPFSLSRLVAGRPTRRRAAGDARAGTRHGDGGHRSSSKCRARASGCSGSRRSPAPSPPTSAPTEIAVAVAAAVESWRADVVLIAMSDGAWGTPRHLRDVLREAARTGRGGRGAAIVCSVGDPAKNHSRAEDSAAIGADDLASQPWVIAAAACDGAGRWLRARFDYQRTGSPGTTYNRFGPSVALAASGESQVFGGVLAADDSSQAAALVAAGAAAVLQHAPADDPRRSARVVVPDRRRARRDRRARRRHASPKRAAPGSRRRSATGAIAWATASRSVTGASTPRRRRWRRRIRSPPRCSRPAAAPTRPTA